MLMIVFVLLINNIVSTVKKNVFFKMYLLGFLLVLAGPELPRTIEPLSFLPANKKVWME